MRVSSTTPSRSSSSSSTPFSLSTFSALFLAFPSVISALTFDCKDVAASGKHFDFSELKGVHQVHWLGQKDLLHHSQDNFTFVLDLCGGLQKAAKLGCHSGARICGINNQIDLATNNITTEARDISGTYTSEVRRPMDPKYELLKDSGSHADVGKEGIRAELHGGKFPWKGGIDQMAIIEFVCDKERTGLEGDEKGDDKDGDDKEDGGDKDDGNKEKDGDKDKGDEKRSLQRREESKCEDSDRSLRFCGYDPDVRDKKEVNVLRLEWRTKYACENAESPGGGSSHWGFFTWFIIILFLAVAAYLIFGSWLNYNRYGARGWDLLPHGDTIRDIPYLLKDFARRVVNTVQGSGSRGGYSAV